MAAENTIFVKNVPQEIFAAYERRAAIEGDKRTVVLNALAMYLELSTQPVLATSDLRKAVWDSWAVLTRIPERNRTAGERALLSLIVGMSRSLPTPAALHVAVPSQDEVVSALSSLSSAREALGLAEIVITERDVAISLRLNVAQSIKSWTRHTREWFATLALFVALGGTESKTFREVYEHAGNGDAIDKFAKKAPRSAFVRELKRGDLPLWADFSATQQQAVSTTIRNALRASVLPDV